MTTTRRLATAMVACTIGTLSFAAPAHADPALLNGVYAGADADPANTWTIASNCAPTGCTATVSSNQGWTSNATFADGYWNFAVTKPDGVICPDGRYEPAVISISIDPVTLAGSMAADSNYGCPGGIVSRTPIQLQKVG